MSKLVRSIEESEERPGTKWLLLHGLEGAVSLMIMMKSFLGYGRDVIGSLDYHSPKPLYEDQESYGPCIWLEGVPCYIDGSGVMGSELAERWVEGSEEEVWSAMESYYRSRLVDEGED